MISLKNAKVLSNEEMLTITGGASFECSCIVDGQDNIEGLTISGGGHDLNSASDLAADICGGFADMGLPITGAVCSQAQQ